MYKMAHSIKGKKRKVQTWGKTEKLHWTDESSSSWLPGRAWTIFGT